MPISFLLNSCRLPTGRVPCPLMDFDWNNPAVLIRRKGRRTKLADLLERINCEQRFGRLEAWFVPTWMFQLRKLFRSHSPGVNVWNSWYSQAPSFWLQVLRPCSRQLRRRSSEPSGPSADTVSWHRGRDLAGAAFVLGRNFRAVCNEYIQVHPHQFSKIHLNLA